MTASSPSMLALLSQVDRKGTLTERVRDLPVPQFAHLLEQITTEFEHCIRAIDMINNDALETLLEQLLEAFTLKIGQVLQADRTTIFLVDEEKEQIWSKIAQADTKTPLEIRVPIGVGIAGTVAATGECLNIPDAYSHPLFNPEVDQETGYRTRNILCMPIFSTRHQQVVAVVQLLNKRGGAAFSREDEQQFREFADSMGIILESCNAFYMAARNQRGVAALLKATACLGQSLDLEQTLQTVMNEARTLMQADRSTLFLIDAQRGELWSKVATADGKALVDIRMPIDRGIAGYVASTGQTLNIANAYEDPRFEPSFDSRTGYRTRTILCMPIFNSAGVLIGVTQLINKHQGIFNTSDEEFMRAFNIQAGVALENAQLFQSVLLERQYQKDVLESLSDAVISTDMEGKIVTINDAALVLLGLPVPGEGARSPQADGWQQQLIGKQVWQVMPIDSLQMRLSDSLQHGARHYVPEQILKVDRSVLELLQDEPAAQTLGEIERSVNLTVNPLTNPEGGVRGGVVVLEDISREKRMKATMYRYMTPGVAERVMALGEDALMVGERKDVTILFSDIRGYTSLTEKMEAPEVVSLLNTYFETMVEAVFNYEGTLDKFIGDALMAVFGAPLPLENHAWMSVQSALDMRRRLAEFNQQRSRADHPPIRFGIGISSGEVVSGNIGSQKRMDYTVIGDGVDVSSRLEGITKEYGCDIILSEFTYDLCRDQVWVRELDCIRVKGKTKPVRIYELIDDRQTPLSDQMQEFLEHYETGRTAYLSRDFQRAVMHLKAAQAIRRDDRTTAVHLQRAENFLRNPPPQHWTGIFTMTTK